jgi:flagellar M-ring protein FliF
MDQVRRIIGNITKQLGPLAAGQKLLLASLAAVVVLTLLLVSQFAGRATMVPLMPGATAEEQTRAAAHLQAAGFSVTTVNGNLSVPSEDQYRARAAIAAAGAGPADTKLMFSNLIEKQNWMMPRNQLDQMYLTALSNELSKVISAFPGIDSATVFVSNPQPMGLGAPARRPTAQVTVFPKAGSALQQTTVNALADLVSGSIAGLAAADVAVIDGLNKRSHRAGSPDDLFAGTYIEQVAKVEERVREKIQGHLAAFIPGVVVSVNAIVDGARRETKTTKVLPRGEGTESMLRRENTNSDTSSAGGSRGAEPGLGANVGLDITRGGGASGTSTNSEQGETEFDNQFGTTMMHQQDARGRPTKVNATISVGREFMLEVLRRRAGTPAAAAGGGGGGGSTTEPTDDQINAAWDGPSGERARIEALVRPLLETEAGAGGAISAGTVVVSLLPVALTGPTAGMPGGGGGGLGAGGGGGLGGVAAIVGSDLVRQLVLGALAALAIGLMIVMVRKAGKAQPLPSAEELVGIPPALEANSDLVGEADQTDTPMTGIEIDADKLKTSKMLDEVTELVKTNPTSAATVFSRWLATEN